MRKLMWFSIGFCAAIAVGAYLLMGNILALLGVVFAAAAVGCFVFMHRLRLLRIPAAISLGCAVGFLFFWVYEGGYLSPIREIDGVTARAAIEIIDYSFQNEGSTVADGNVCWEGKQYRVRMYLHEKKILNPGDVVEGIFSFRITDKGGKKEPTFHRGDGIQLLAYQDGAFVIRQQALPWWYYPVAELRHWILDRITELFPADTEAFARALLLGDDSDIGYELNTAFKVSGVRHIIAVSGLHVSILFGLVYLVSARRRLLTLLVGIPVVVLFAAVAGFSPSVVRASGMHILMAAALLFDREYDAPTALGVAGAAILAMDPLAVTAVGFQLSFGCVAGILLFAAPIRDWLMSMKVFSKYKKTPYIGKILKGIALSFAISISAVSLTTPLMAMYFGSVSLVSPLTNFLTLWIVTFVFYGIMAACLVAAVSLAAGQFVAALTSVGIRYLILVAKWIAAFPLAAVYTHSIWIVVWIVFVYAMVTLLIVLPRKYPGILVSLGTIGLCAALFASWLPSMMDDCRVTVLDVGQGQSIILQSNGKTFLVDCGGSYDDDAADIAAEYLLSMGVFRIDGMILTHYDRDHAGGALSFLSRMEVDALYLPAQSADSDLARQLLSCDRVHRIENDTVAQYDSVKLTFFTSKQINSKNESSLCVLFQAADCDILITGDRSAEGELELLENAEIPQLEILIAGHHGSKNSTTQPLLEVTRPQVVVISAGENNPYGHPAQELLDRLEEYGCIVFRTDQDGTITIRR